ncbi:hypothetical protein QA641_33420 [Bradyrhizobium sp. CB1650]|uniref:hypothetical protein n=1 Tax=Bradyrhizobium sp. CB1650 TaxID=3039153 RepID=UPI0024352B26|nr:hypothetical protein [Bradyrhizobium sp. CB1650]WGD50454.1 hypothetical protein QA641_33420 [Bradyrhizobium sp. CB1650]
MEKFRLSARAAGDPCARAVVGGPSPSFAGVLSLARYENKALMDELESAASRGLL